MKQELIRPFVGAVVVCILALGQAPAYAFGHDGHETTGAIAAQRRAGTRAERELARILGPDEDLQNGSVWMDCAKGKMYCGQNPTLDMRAFTTRNPHHHHYHFADIPIDEPRYRDGAVGTSPDDIVHTLAEAITVLQGRTDRAHNPHDFTEREAVLVVAHLVGDLHQPLHVGAIYLNMQNGFVHPRSESEIQSDALFTTEGGNWLMLGSHNLHGLWDTDLVKRAMRRVRARTPAEFAAVLLARGEDVPATPGDPSSWPRQWADESLRVARTALTPVRIVERSEARDRDGSHPRWIIELPRAYMAENTQQVATQLKLAGWRLADLFMAIWP